jgi:hypothetical protein
MKKSVKWVRREKITELSIKSLDLPIRSYRALKVKDIRTIYDLLLMSERELLRIEGFGRKALKETSKSLKMMGLSLLPISIINLSTCELLALNSLFSSFEENGFFQEKVKIYAPIGDGSGGG